MPSRPRGRQGQGRAVGRLEAARRAAEAYLAGKYGPKGDTPPRPRTIDVVEDDAGSHPGAPASRLEQRGPQAQQQEADTLEGQLKRRQAVIADFDRKLAEARARRIKELKLTPADLEAAELGWTRIGLEPGVSDPFLGGS